MSVLVLGSCGATKPPVPRDIDVKSLMSASDVARLEALAAERLDLQSNRDRDYRIGSDDLVEITIPDLLTGGALRGATRTAPFDPAIPNVEAAPAFRQGLRVSAMGDITIPEIGSVRAAGLTARGLEQEIARRLRSAGILQRPQVGVVIVEHRSQVVAVVGSVQRPGLYPLTRPGATIADLIWVAGGPTKEAGRLVQFAAAQPGTAVAGVGAPLTLRTQPSLQVAANTERVDAADSVADSGSPIAGADSEDTPATVEPAQLGEAGIRIDLETLLSPTDDNQRAVDVPVWPGDVISIPPAGVVLVDGWVYKPGAYPISRNLTVTGAVASAGGKMFPANLTEVTMQRVRASGRRAHVPDRPAGGCRGPRSRPGTPRRRRHLPAGEHLASVSMGPVDTHQLRAQVRRRDPDCMSPRLQLHER